MTRVLLVDDDELLRELLQMQIELEGHDVEVAEDGEAALEILDRESFDVVVLDLMMPVMDGLRFMRVLKERTTAPPEVVVLSSMNRPGLREELLAVGVREVVRKPIEIGALLAAIAAAEG